MADETTQRKNLEVVAYISKHRPRASVTMLIKLAYLADLIYHNKNKKQISSFEYIRYTYGPFDNKIYAVLNELTKDGVLRGEEDFAYNGAEFVVYTFNDESDFEFGELDSEEKEIIEGVIEELKGHGAKLLTDVAYKTKPMLKFGATQGGSEHLNEKLDFDAS